MVRLRETGSVSLATQSMVVLTLGRMMTSEVCMSFLMMTVRRRRKDGGLEGNWKIK